MTKPKALESFPSSLHPGYGPYAAVVDRVIDGDTVVCQISPGLEVYPVVSIRIFGVNAPELRDAGGQEAKAFLSALLPRDKPVLLRSQGWSFNRLVASVLLEDGTDVASVLVEEGHAVWVDY